MKQFFNAVVMGASAGGMKIVKDMVISLPKDFGLPVIIVQHVADTSDSKWADMLNEISLVHVKEAEEKEPIVPGKVYLAPANYHLLIESDYTFTLTVDDRVNYARPAIDVLFETAAEAYKERLIGVICTGANSDGAKGLLYIKQLGGKTIVQDPSTAEASSMPLAAIGEAAPEHILSPMGILNYLLVVHKNQILS